MPSARWMALTALASFSISVAVGVARDSLSQVFLAIASFFFAAAAAILGGIVLVVIYIVAAASGRARFLPHAIKSLVLVGIFASMQIPGVIAGVFIYQEQVESAKRWCDSLKPRLEEWRVRNGEYPSELSKLGGELDPPKMCAERLIYRATPDGYVLDFGDGGLFSGWAYSSERGTWSRYD